MRRRIAATFAIRFATALAVQTRRTLLAYAAASNRGNPCLVSIYRFRTADPLQLFKLQIYQNYRSALSRVRFVPRVKRGLHARVARVFYPVYGFAERIN